MWVPSLLSMLEAPILLAFVATFVLGSSWGGIYLVPWNIYNFIPDIDEALTKERREAIYAGVMTLTRKITQAFSIMLVPEKRSARELAENGVTRPGTQDKIQRKLVKPELDSDAEMMPRGTPERHWTTGRGPLERGGRTKVSVRETGGTD